MTAVVYRLFDADDVLLYIGLTENFDLRLKGHLHPTNTSGRVPHWREIVAGYDHHTIEEYPDRLSASAAERIAIHAERPPLNVRFNRDATPAPPMSESVRGAKVGTTSLRISAKVRGELAIRAISRTEFAEAVGWSKTTAHRRLNGLSAWNINEVHAAAMFFGTTASAFMSCQSWWRHERPQEARVQAA